MIRMHGDENNEYCHFFISVLFQRLLHFIQYDSHRTYTHVKNRRVSCIYDRSSTTTLSLESYLSNIANFPAFSTPRNDSGCVIPLADRQARLLDGMTSDE